MGSKSNIIIHQTLHGYRNGHQLLASSLELAVHTKRLLLFQSDLSGSMPFKSYYSYLTGYPIQESGLYAIAKSWYANEMQRPGCVWTQTFLIEFSDIGKFIDFSVLLPLFNRPNNITSKFEDYSVPFELDIRLSPVLLQHEEILKKRYIAQGLYFKPNQPLYIPSDDPKEWEETITSIWSDQWPRLRRNFTFCTGALDKKELNGHEFDLQVVPFTLFRQNYIGEIFDLINPETKPGALSSILKVKPDNNLRRFLWLVGSDVPGTRENYLPLLSIYQLYSSKNIPLTELINLISEFFPKPIEAQNLKKKLFGKNSIILEKVSELDLIKNVLTSKNYLTFNFADLQINDRLLLQIHEGNLSLSEFIWLWNNSPKNELDINLWEQASFTYDESIIDLIENNNYVLSIILEKSYNIIEFDWIWKCNLDCQKIIIKQVGNEDSINWKKVLHNILNIHSLVIIDLYELRGNSILDQSLDWLNEAVDFEYLIYEWQLIIKNHASLVRKWLYANRKELNINIYLLIYDIYNHQLLLNFNLPVDFWRRAGKFAVSYNNRKIASSVLGVGFSRGNNGGEWIVSEVFQYIYDNALNGKLNYEDWNIIPREEYIEVDTSWLTEVIKFFKYKKNLNKVSDWDFCEILIRSLVHLYIKYPLNKQAFTKTLSQDYTFYRAIEYCLSLRKGQKFLQQLEKQSKNKSFELQHFQRNLLKQINIS
ncbi:hypothetical protein GCM10028805_46010 [Spirosoma harenae]